ncbi:MAG: hypothetical protein PHI87_00140 [Candidatus Methanomethylophilus sp.]|nr:hypothetical protein [Methanomethylophilus sp.]
MTFHLINFTAIPTKTLTGGQLFRELRKRDTIHTDDDGYIQITGLGGVTYHEVDGVKFPIPQWANTGAIFRATKEQEASGYRGWCCPNQACGVAVFITDGEMAAMPQSLMALRLRVIHELLHHYQQPADDMDWWIEHSGLFLARVAGFLNRFSIDVAQWVYYYWLIQRIRWP